MFHLLHPDPEKSPLCCDICFATEIDYMIQAQTWGAEAELVQMYWCDREKLTVCENCRCFIVEPTPVHNWRDEGF